MPNFSGEKRLKHNFKKIVVSSKIKSSVESSESSSESVREIEDRKAEWNRKIKVYQERFNKIIEQMTILINQETGKSKKRKRTKDEMSREEKWQLVKDIERIKGEHIPKVICIIRSNEKFEISADCAELSIDFDKLKPSTLRELQSYVTSCVAKRPRTLLDEGVANTKVGEVPSRLFESSSSSESNSCSGSSSSSDSCDSD